MFPNPIEWTVAVLNKEGSFAIRQGYAGKVLDGLAQYLHMKALARTSVELPSNFEAPQFPDLYLSNPKVRRIIRQRSATARERTSRHLQEFSLYEKAATIYRSELKTLVDSWIAADQNFQQWSENNPQLSASLQKTLARMKATIRPANQGASIVVEPWTRRDTPVENARREAVGHFAGIIVPAETGRSARIGRCAYCDRYYLNKRGRKDSRFCPAPRNCGRRYTATQAVLKKAKQERDRKLGLISNAFQSWSPEKGSWREYLASETGLSKAFITRIFNRELKHLQRRINQNGNL